MKHLVEHIYEGLFDSDLVKSKTVPEKLTYVLKKFLEDKITLGEDYQGNYRWWEINPSSMKIDNPRNIRDRIVNYCKKVDGLDVREEKLPGFNNITKVFIGDKKYYFVVDYTYKFFNGIRVSEEFYKLEAIPHDQLPVIMHGRNWWKQRL